jgi:hypothetical protein
VISRRDAAIRLDIPLEQATRHGLPARMTDDELAAIENDPPSWLQQSRANRTGKPVWTTLTCEVCGFSETVRPKKWWPEYTHLMCDDHDESLLPAPAPDALRSTV